MASAKRLKEEREKLIKKIQDAGFRVARVSNIDTSHVTIEGGTFPATFDRVQNELHIWGRGSRNAGAKMSVKNLVLLEQVLQAWSAEVSFDE